MKAVILSRVSTKDQEEGHSLPAQITRLKDYAKRKNFEVIKVFQIIESSTLGKRKEFMDMINFCKSQRETVAIIADAVDRVQRSFKESVLLDDLIRQEKIELHFYREGMVIGKKSTSTDIMRWDFCVMGAKAYVLQLSENVKRSLEYKLNNGEIIGPAPCGYENYVDTNGKHLIRKSEPCATYLKKLFEIYSLGGTSIHKLAQIANQYNIRGRTGKKITTTSMISIIDNPFYYGEMLAKGKLYRHIYDRLITKELWDKCQEQRKAQSAKPFKVGEIPFLYRGIFTDFYKNKICSCEIKKNKFIYVVCHKENGSRLYVPQKDIDKQVISILNRISVPNEIIEDFKRYIRNSKQTEIEYKRAEFSRLQGEITKINHRLDVLFDMRLDDEITKEEYEIKRNKCRIEKLRLEEQIKVHNKADDGFNNTTLLMFNLFSSASKIFQSNISIKDKQMMLHFIFEELKLKEGIISYKLKRPFYFVENCCSQLGICNEEMGDANLFEPKEMQGFNGDFGQISEEGKKEAFELQIIDKNQEVRYRNLTSVQYGWQKEEYVERKSAQLYCVLVNHRSEILEMKEQVQLIRSLFAA